MDISKELGILKEKGDAPNWMTVPGYVTISKGYRLKGETPKQMYLRVAGAAAQALGKPDKTKDFYDAMWKNWLCPASPVLSNLGTSRGLPISCYTIDIGDSVKSITQGISELAILSKNSGGVGINFDRIRCRNSPINNGLNGVSQGIIPFAKMYDSTILGISQHTRRGAASLNLNIEHGDWSEFIRMRRPEGDINLQCGNLHHCAMITNSFMQKVVDGDRAARAKWVELMRSRVETGEPYILFLDNVNQNNPLGYIKNNLKVSATNICSEITLHTDDEHSFVCCLSSLNLTRWDEWKGTPIVQTCIEFLNGVLNEFLEKSKNMWGLEKVYQSALKGRALGLGVLGWHSLLQARNMPFDSFDSMRLNAEIFSHIKAESTKASNSLAEEFGEPEWCKGTGMYNTHLIAIAPTRSNSIISGDVSPGIEPIIANAYADKSSKGTFIRHNPHLEVVLETYGKNTPEVWKKIARNNGSVQDLDFLPVHHKKVFLTAYEIDQMSIIRQASQRQKWVCQSQSLNLFFPSDTKPAFFNRVHLEAWKMGLKTLYYCRTKSSIKADVASREEGCASCEG